MVDVRSLDILLERVLRWPTLQQLQGMMQQGEPLCAVDPARGSILHRLVVRAGRKQCPASQAEVAAAVALCRLPELPLGAVDGTGLTALDCAMGRANLFDLCRVFCEACAPFDVRRAFGDDTLSYCGIAARRFATWYIRRAAVAHLLQTERAEARLDAHRRGHRAEIQMWAESCRVARTRLAALPAEEHVEVRCADNVRIVLPVSVARASHPWAAYIDSYGQWDAAAADASAAADATAAAATGMPASKRSSTVIKTIHAPEYRAAVVLAFAEYVNNGAVEWGETYSAPTAVALVRFADQHGLPALEAVARGDVQRLTTAAVVPALYDHAAALPEDDVDRDALLQLAEAAAVEHYPDLVVDPWLHGEGIPAEVRMRIHAYAHARHAGGGGPPSAGAIDA